MKKTFLFLLIVYTTTVNSQAQIAKNSILMGGQLSLSGIERTSSQPSSYNINSQSINLSIGKAFRENKLYGFTLGYSHWRSYYPNSGDTNAAHSNEFGVGLFFRQYKNLGSKFYLFAQVDAGYTFSIEKRNDLNAQTNQQIKNANVLIGITPGLSYQLCKKLHAEITLPNLVQGTFSTFKSTKPQEPGFYQKDQRYGVSSSLTNYAVFEMIGFGFRFIL